MLDGTRTTKSVKAPDGDGPTGRIKLGTESNGGFRHITVRRCQFTHCRGLALETVDGAAMEDIRVSDLTMTDICNAPIYIRLGDRMRAPEGFHPSSVDDIRISNVHVEDADSRYACLIAGIPGHPVTNVRIKNLYVKFRGGITLQDVEEQRNTNPFFFSKTKSKPYPEPSAHGIQPAWAFSISHAKDIRISNCQLETASYDERPPVSLVDTEGVRIRKTVMKNEGR